jgi:hypothetical protein
MSAWKRSTRCGPGALALGLVLSAGAAEAPPAVPDLPAAQDDPVSACPVPAVADPLSAAVPAPVLWQVETGG